jgi:hypothetical protein
MIQNPLCAVVFALAIGFGPVVAVEFTVTLATRAGDACLVGVGLEKEFVAVPAFDPPVVDG